MRQHSNFIILYKGREGSSAIISMLSAQDGICVPVFEDLDVRNFTGRHRQEDFPAVADQIFRTGIYGGVTRHPSLFDGDPATADSIGFKARLFASPEIMAPVLLANRVKVFALVRREFTEFVASAYVNTMRPADADGKAADVHPQFGQLNMDDEAWQKLLQSIDQIRLPVDLPSYRKLAEQLTLSRWRTVKYAEALSKAGVEVIPIHYEDFLADRVAFIRGMMIRLGFPPDVGIRDETAFTKVMITPARRKLELSGHLVAILSCLPDRIRYRRALRELRRIGERWPASVASR